MWHRKPVGKDLMRTEPITRKLTPKQLITAFKYPQLGTTPREKFRSVVSGIKVTGGFSDNNTTNTGTGGGGTGYKYIAEYPTPPTAAPEPQPDLNAGDWIQQNGLPVPPAEIDLKQILMIGGLLLAAIYIIGKR